MIDTAIYTLLSNASAITALVSTRIYPLPSLQADQNITYPCVTYNVSEDGAESSFDGQGTFERVSIEIDAWGDTYQSMGDIADAIKTAVKNYSGTVSGVIIDQITIDSTVSVYEDQIEKYRRTLIATLQRR
ncbi:MAG: DUF3168 domain-containing protein [Ketobacter sp.]|nr:DUF3168 domain-containing protein [Ketobacter sp.]